MRKLYYADPHFFHEGAFRRRQSSMPFSSVSDMNDFLIDQHNSRAENDTDVYILGSFSTNQDITALERCFNALKGRKHFIVGGSENSGEVLSLKWTSLLSSAEIRDAGEWILLYNLPMRSWPGQNEGYFHFHGTTYGQLPSVDNAIDVGLDVHGFRPISASEAIEAIKVRDALEDRFVAAPTTSSVGGFRY